MTDKQAATIERVGEVVRECIEAIMDVVRPVIEVIVKIVKVFGWAIRASGINPRAVHLALHGKKKRLRKKYRDRISKGILQHLV